MGDKSRKARRGKSKRGGRRQKTEEATNEMSDREKIKCKIVSLNSDMKISMKRKIFFCLVASILIFYSVYHYCDSNPGHCYAYPPLFTHQHITTFLVVPKMNTSSSLSPHEQWIPSEKLETDVQDHEAEFEELLKRNKTEKNIDTPHSNINEADQETPNKSINDKATEPGHPVRIIPDPRFDRKREQSSDKTLSFLSVPHREEKPISSNNVAKIFYVSSKKDSPILFGKFLANRTLEESSKRWNLVSNNAQFLKRFERVDTTVFDPASNEENRYDSEPPSNDKSSITFQGKGRSYEYPVSKERQKKENSTFEYFINEGRTETEEPSKLNSSADFGGLSSSPERGTSHNDTEKTLNNYELLDSIKEISSNHSKKEIISDIVKQTLRQVLNPNSNLTAKQISKLLLNSTEVNTNASNSKLMHYSSKPTQSFHLQLAEKSIASKDNIGKLDDEYSSKRHQAYRDNKFPFSKGSSTKADRNELNQKQLRDIDSVDLRHQLNSRKSKDDNNQPRKITETKFNVENASDFNANNVLAVINPVLFEKSPKTESPLFDSNRTLAILNPVMYEEHSNVKNKDRDKKPLVMKRNLAKEEENDEGGLGHSTRKETLDANVTEESSSAESAYSGDEETSGEDQPLKIPLQTLRIPNYRNPSSTHLYHTTDKHTLPTLEKSTVTKQLKHKSPEPMGSLSSDYSEEIKQQQGRKYLQNVNINVHNSQNWDKINNKPLSPPASSGKIVQLTRTANNKKKLVNGIMFFKKFSCTPLFPHTVLYNRIFKTGSTSLNEYMKNISKRLDYTTFVGSTEDWYDIGDSYPYPQAIEKFAVRSPRRRSYAAHFYFRPQLNLRKPFTYINQVRDPVRRLVSHYFYMRTFNRPKRRIREMKRTGQWNETLEQCLERQHKGCQSNVMTRFFCGIEPYCKTGSKKAIDKAKYNMQHYYAAIGLLDYADLYLRILRRRLPRFFPKHTKLLDRRKENADREYFDKVSQETLTKIKNQNMADIEIYNFAKELFRRQVNVCNLGRTKKKRSNSKTINLPLPKLP